MAFDRERAEAALVEIVDPFDGARVLGLGVRLPGGVIATSCQCLPRPTGIVHFPDPDAPSMPTLVRVRAPGTARSAAAVVTSANPYAGLVLLRSATAAGLDVPAELNPVISAERLIEGLAPALPELEATPDGPAWLRTHEHRWIDVHAGRTRLAAVDRAEPIGGATSGAPVFNEAGRVVGIVGLGDEADGEARLCRLAEHLPGWVIDRALQVAALGNHDGG